MRVRDVMQAQIHCCSIEHTLNDAARIMWEHDLGFLPVVDSDGSVVGVITDRDICMAAYTQGIALSASNVASAMSRSVVSVHPADTVGFVEALMRKNQIRRVPVLDETGQPLGVVTMADLALHGEATTLGKLLEAHGIAKTLAAISARRSPAN